MAILTSTQVDCVVALDELTRESHRIAKEHGFHDHYLNDVNDRAVVPEKIALCHTELSEVIAADRNMALDYDERDFEILHELADTIIRVFDLAAVVQSRDTFRLSPKYENVTFGRILVEKMITNDNRPRLHNKRY